MTFSYVPMNPKWFEPASKFVDSQFPSAVAKLGQLVEIPGIAWPTFDQDNLERSAKKVADEFRGLDFFDFVEIRKAAKPSGELGAPAVVARKAGHPAAPHILLYAHHDVQPPGDSALWNTEPFEATLKGDRLFGRGASDDKSGIITHLTSLRTLIELATEIRMGVTVFIEGEEEAGSESFPKFLKANHADLAADLIIVADSGNWSEDVPALTNALRGMVSQTFTLKTLDHALHSGMYGGPLPDATTAMIRLLASLTDEVGNVAISGLDSVSIDGPDLTNEEFTHAAGLLPGVERLGDKSVTQQIWGEPAVTVIGIDLPAVDVSSNTAQSEVRAKISLRLAPSQSPESGLEALRRHLSQHAPFGAQIELGRHETGSGYLAKDGWAAKLAHEAFSASWPNPSVNMGIGGSIPFISQFAEAFPDAEILVTGVEEPDSRAHSPNESQHLPTLRRAILAQSMILLNGNDLER
jgi:acetylornithine deacetylase/succinyl-diaminopimelate desuccinylase-like protein